MKNAHKTAITRKAPSVPMRWLMSQRPVLVDALRPWAVLDFGCGKGFDADHWGFDKFDPHYFPDTEVGINYEVITCNYVLNVVSPGQQESILLMLKI